MSIKNYFTKKQNTYLKVLQLRYCGRDSIIQVRNRPYFHYGPFGRTKNKMEVAQTVVSQRQSQRSSCYSHLRWAHQNSVSLLVEVLDLKSKVTRCDLSERFFCIHARSLCKFLNDEVSFKNFEYNRTRYIS